MLPRLRRQNPALLVQRVASHTLSVFEPATRPYHSAESLTVRFWVRKST